MLHLHFRELASELTKDPTLRDSSAWQTQYRTTNRVYMSDQYILKVYLTHASFATERYFYSKRSLLTFCTPEPVAFVELPSWGAVAIFRRAQGRTLLSLISEGSKLRPHFVERLVDALIEFERLPEFLEQEQETWTYGFSISPVCKRLHEIGLARAALLLTTLAASADGETAALPRVPCFDLYPGNIILARHEQHEVVTHVDFDKVNRAVPAGEQLSHIALVPGFRNELRRLLPKYAAAIGVGGADLAANLRFAAFFRACAGLRDSIIGTEGDEGEPEHRAQRTKTQSRMLKLAAGSLADIHRKAGISEAEFLEIMRGFHAL